MQGAVRLVMATRLVGDVVKEETDAAKVVARELMTAAGAERVRVLDQHGTNMGAVTLAAGRSSARVTDERAFGRWVEDRYPTEVERIVRDAFRRRLLAEAAKAGDPVDTATGEVIPGVVVEQGDPYIVARPTEDARDRMRTMLANSGLLALASGATPVEEVGGDAA
jgi:hypothetical protein